MRGTVLDPHRPVVLVSDAGSEVEAATRLGRIGFDTVAGYVAGGMQALGDAPQRVERIERITVGALVEQLDSSAPPVVVDVRTPGEWATGHIDGALHVPLSRLRDQLDSLPRDRVLVVYCASGYRATIAASLMRLDGREDVAVLVGGLAAWEAGRPVHAAAS